MRYGTPEERVASVEAWTSLSDLELLKSWNSPEDALQYADVVSSGIQLVQRLGKDKLIKLTREIPAPVMVSGVIEAQGD